MNEGPLFKKFKKQLLIYLAILYTYRSYQKGDNLKNNSILPSATNLFKTSYEYLTTMNK